VAVEEADVVHRSVRAERGGDSRPRG
jgi:hypothetical protein